MLGNGSTQGGNPGKHLLSDFLNGKRFTPPPLLMALLTENNFFPDPLREAAKKKVHPLVAGPLRGGGG